MSVWSEYCDFLKSVAPTKNRVVIRRAHLLDHGSTAQSENGTIYVTIRKRDSLSVQIDTLTHEWAHVLEMDGWDPHGRVWLDHYGRLYHLSLKFMEHKRK